MFKNVQPIFLSLVQAYIIVEILCNPLSRIKGLAMFTVVPRKYL